MTAKAATKTGAGALTEQLTILSPTPVSVVIASITRVGTTATVTTATAHGFADGDFVTLSGVTPAGYNGEFAIDVTGTSSFTIGVAGSPVTPATVPGAVVFVSDSQGGQGSGWWTLAVVAAKVLPLSAGEQLAAGGIAAVVNYRATLYYRPDIKPTMRCSWTKYRETVARTLEIHAVQDVPDELRRMMTLDLGEVQQ